MEWKCNWKVEPSPPASSDKVAQQPCQCLWSYVVESSITIANPISVEEEDIETVIKGNFYSFGFSNIASAHESSRKPRFSLSSKPPTDWLESIGNVGNVFDLFCVTVSSIDRICKSQILINGI